jgi:hypothetical protein
MVPGTINPISGWESSDGGYRSIPRATPITIAANTARTGRYVTMFLASFELRIAAILSLLLDEQ